VSSSTGSPSGSRTLWLSRVALGFVALAAVMGWGASFVGLHAYGQAQMVGFSFWTAWLVPGTFDGAAFGATLITYRASIYGRSALRGRLLMWSFTAISSWINWIHQITPEAQIVAAGLPIAAVAVFDVVLAEMRADFEQRQGKRRLRLRPGLLLLRWLADRTGTNHALREQITNLPVAQIAGLATANSTETPTNPAEPTQAAERETPTQDMPRPASPAPAPTPAPPAPVRDSRQQPPKLPPAVLTQLRGARDQAEAEGRALTTADIQTVIKLPDPMAQAVLDELSTPSAA